MAIPRRLLIVAASAVAAGAVLYVRNKMREQKERARKPGSAPPPANPAPASATPPAGADAAAAPAPSGTGQSGSARELALFLAGESWYDEVGWQGIREREGIEGPDGWLRTNGKDVLTSERTKLATHPALLAGCRRRWIVVCRYAGIDVADAAALWNSTEA